MHLVVNFEYPLLDSGEGSDQLGQSQQELMLIVNVVRAIRHHHLGLRKNALATGLGGVQISYTGFRPKHGDVEGFGQTKGVTADLSGHQVGGSPLHDVADAPQRSGRVEQQQ